MTQEQKLDYLIDCLQKMQSSPFSSYRPQSLEEKKELFRALMNIWEVRPLSEEFLAVQDSYFQEELAGKAVRTLADMPSYGNNLYLWQGDITLLAVDAIVNAGNKMLLGCFVPLHKCIDNAIHSFAGLQLRAECSRIMQGGHEPTGQAKITPAYNLPGKYVIHTVGPIVGAKLTERDEELLCSCYRNCLKLAAENGLKSIAFCCLSTGEFRFPNQRAAELAVKTVRECQRDFAADMHIVFNVFKDLDYAIYKKLLERKEND